MGRFIRLLKALSREERGNALMIFGLAIPVLFGVAGLAIDFSRMHSAKIAAQNTMDGALLAAANKPSIDGAGVNEAVTSHFARAGVLKHGAAVSGLAGSVDAQSVIVGQGVLHVPTTLMNVLGFSSLDVPIVSRVTRGLGNIEIALVLDTTKSMAGSRLSSIKTAASDLVDTIFALPDASSKVKVSLVPFAQYVNVGLHNRYAAWTDVPPDTTGSSCWDTYPSAVQSNCRTVTYTAYDDGVPYTYQVEECDGSWGTPVNVCGTTSNVWNGCAGARSRPLNVKDEQYSSRIPGIRNVSCPSPILPLSRSPSDIKASINAMVANGFTYIPTGLVWGWRTLSNRAPFTESADDPLTAGGSVRKFLVLMTDGANTRSPRWPEGDHERNDTILANQLTREACDNIKADTQSRIEIFTIAFEVADETIKDILRYCATPGGAFFDAVDYAKLIAAFGAIGSSVSIARVAQ